MIEKPRRAEHRHPERPFDMSMGCGGSDWDIDRMSVSGAASPGLLPRCSHSPTQTLAFANLV